MVFQVAHSSESHNPYQRAKKRKFCKHARTRNLNWKSYERTHKQKNNFFLCLEMFFHLKKLPDLKTNWIWTCSLLMHIVYVLTFSTYQSTFPILSPALLEITVTKWSLHLTKHALYNNNWFSNSRKFLLHNQSHMGF